MKVLGIDPASGVTSPTALALIDTETNELLNYWKIQPDIHKLNHQQRVAYIGQKVQYIIYQECPDLIFCEHFVIQGRNGHILHQVIGAIMSAAGHRHGSRFGSVFNTTVKRLVTGNGGADKVQVALGVQKQLTASTDVLVKLTVAKEFDVTDAAAIAIAGVLQAEEEKIERQLGSPVRKKAKQKKSSRPRKNKTRIKMSNRRGARIRRRSRNT